MTTASYPTRRAVLAAAGLLLPCAAPAQAPGRTYRLAQLSPLPRDAPPYVGLFAELRQFGFIEGQNLSVDPRGCQLRGEQFAQVAMELVRAKPDVMLATGDAAIRAAQQATATIPILASTDDMVGAGLVHSMAHPDGNTTGISLLSTELDGKRQEILLEMVPGIRAIAALADANTTTSGELQALQAAARARRRIVDLPGCRAGGDQGRHPCRKNFGCPGA